MKVKMLHSLMGDDEDRPAGSIQVVSDQYGARLIAGGLAEAFGAPVERAVVESESEKAVKPERRKRKKPVKKKR